MGLYEQIRDIAKMKGYSINRLEQELGFARSSINKFNTNTPSVDKISQIADFLGVSVEYLMTGQNHTEGNVAEEYIAQDDSERKLLMLCRNATDANPDEKEALVKAFESTIDIYLKAKGLK